MPTIKELAELAGVSPSTISNVLNGRSHKMKPETLEKVEQVIKETNYVSNMAGRLLANHGSKIIGVFLTYTRGEERNAIQDPFFSELVGSLEYEIRSAGYYMMLYTTTSVEESLRKAASWNVEGIIVQGAMPWDCPKYLGNDSFPVVFIDSYYDNDVKSATLPFVNVGLNDREGGKLVAEHFYNCGHRRLAFLADGTPTIGVDNERLRGFADKLNELGIEFSEDNNYIPISYKRSERHVFLKDFAKNQLQNYDALFFASDFYAVDAMNVFYDLGINVPNDISIAGFDDNIYSVHCRPKLTTVRQNVSQKGHNAVELLLKQINGELTENYDLKLPVSLIVRDSDSNTIS